MHTLDQLTATQLTAGTTLNRPSAVICELIDNAIDAQAQQITIYLDAQGTLCVHDDGIGMTVEELPRAFARHTTSKITCYDDVYRLRTLGFRGEALASIAAIARVTCISRTQACASAHELRIAHGQIHDLRPCAGAVGTHITVERLYHAIPQRRNFWRQPHTERQHIVDMCTHYALTYPHIGFRVLYEQHTLLNTCNHHTLQDVLSALWPNEEFTPIDARLFDGQYHLSGFISQRMSPSRRQQIVAINQRPITVRGFMAHMIDEVLPPHHGHHPSVVLLFHLPTDEIDVNLRSHKDELGLRTPSVIARLLYSAIRQRHHGVFPQSIITTHQLPELTLIGQYADWFVWSCVEGLVIMDPANVMAVCGITRLAPGRLCVPPYPIDKQAATIFLSHSTQWEHLGLQFDIRTPDQITLTHLPQVAHTNKLDRSLKAFVHTMRRGGTFAMGIGHFLDPHWLHAQLAQLSNPWDHHAIWMVGHQRIAQALRISAPTNQVPDQSQQ